MSANIYWEPTNTEGKSLPCGAPLTLIKEIENAGLGDLRTGHAVVINETYLPVLRGMAAVYSGVNINNPYWHLINAIEKYGSVRIWAVY